MDSGIEYYNRYLEGDEAAFGQLLSEYRDSLIFFLNRTLNNLSEAEEIAAETFAELIIHPGRYKKSAGFKTYLYAIGHHKMVDQIRRNARHPQLTFEDAGEKSLAYESFEHSVLDKEDNRKLYEAMETLPEHYRDALHLVYFENMSYEQTALIMHKTKKQVDNLLRLAKAALKKALEKEGFVYEG